MLGARRVALGRLSMWRAGPRAASVMRPRWCSNSSAEQDSEKSERDRDRRVLEEAKRILVPDDKEMTLNSWAVEKGQQVASGDAICEIETPDAIFDVVGKYDGIIVDLLAEPGSSLEAEETLCYIADDQAQVDQISQAYVRKMEGKRQDESKTVEPELSETESQEAQVIVQMLDELHLSRYTSIMIDNGYDSLPSFENLTVSDLEELGWKAGHIKSLQKELANQGVTIQQDST